MPEYTVGSFVPPAPLAFVTLRNVDGNREISNIPMLLDTGADATLVPKNVLQSLEIDISNARTFEIEGFDKSESESHVVPLEMIFEGLSFRGEFLLIDQEVGIIGRNVLNNLRLLFDGVKLNWEVV